jgi:hypothetical protein
MANFAHVLQQYLDPLEQRIDGLEKSVRKIEETLNIITRRLPSPSAKQEIAIPAFKKPSLEARAGSYVYRPLDSAVDEIRILVVYSSLDDQDPISCELVHAGLNSGSLKDPASRSSVAITGFKTLSYTWGSPDSSRSIIIEGHRFPVTQNLWAALRHIRTLQNTSKADEELRPTFWWIDAICINQDDVSERNQQVNLMTRIYRKANGVHIWLGEEDDDSELAMDLVRQLGSSGRRGPGEQNVVYPKTTAEQRVAHWRALTAVFQRPWWERVWIRQEVAVAKEATVHCGSKFCTFSAFSLTADILNKIHEQYDFSPAHQHETEVLKPLERSGTSLTSPYLQACILASFRNNMGRTPNVEYRDLTQLILHARSCKATDLRDKVFSMLGLVDPEVWDLEADYRLPVNGTLITAARAIISKKQSLDILASCQNPERRYGLPSWTPNLRDEWKARPLNPDLPPKLSHVAADEEPAFTFEGEGNELLRAKGSCIDVVEKLSSHTPKQNSSAEELDTLSAKWKLFSQAILTNPNRDFQDGIVKYYQENDQQWIQFLSAGTDTGQPRPVTVAPLSTEGNYQMVKSLLLPEQSGESSSNVGDLRGRVHEQLRKFGTGRRLCVTRMGHQRGSAVLVPEDTEPGDEIFIFRGTRQAYVLRNVDDRKYVVVGEAC